MKDKYLYLMMCLLAGPAARAQQVLLQTDVARDTLRPRTGPNRRYFGHLYAGYGLAVGGSSAPGLPLRYGFGSAETQLGGRLKRRFTDHLALVADLRYAYLRYSLAPEPGRPAPFGARPDTETLSYHQVQGELALRLNTGPRQRGNVVGTYLDLLAYGGPALAASHTTTADEPAGQGRVEVIRHQPPYLARWLGGAGLRLGSGRLALAGRYRLSEVLRPVGPAPLPQPPRWVVGLEVSLF